MDKIDILSVGIKKLKDEFNLLSIPNYRADQVYQWIFKKNAIRFDDMNNIPLSLKEKLSRKYSLPDLKIKQCLTSKDGTKKFLFELYDKKMIEAVFIPSLRRNTVCLSTQVGCKFRCRFCASGMKGFMRDLSVSEIIGQILHVRNYTGERIDNYVFMGMGEPLDNLENVIRAIRIMNSSWGLGVGARRITVSTCGIVPGIERLKDFKLQINLSISLHAPNNDLRDRLVPVNKTYPIEVLIKVCKDFIKEKGRMITLEYVLLKSENDSERDIKDLSRIARTLNAKVNIIPYSLVEMKGFHSPSREDVNRFLKGLLKNKVKATVRESKGSDIEAACGQLVMRNL